MDQERYQLVDVVGSGGMATVWRARDVRLDRVVAIKRPHPAPADSATLPRFAREARAAATVSHPNLVPVYDVGEDDIGPYLVMEFVDGPSLAATSVPPERVAALGAQVASALSALHAAGVVHGDVKPANILMAHDRVKLTDFGIARTGNDTTALTREGMVLATPEYAAPETMTGGERTPAADVYALGAVLHELVTGSRWNPGSTATQAMPPAPWVPVLAAMLALDPERRPSAEQLSADLAALERVGPSAVDVPTVPMVASLPVPTGAPPRSGDHRANGRTAMVVFAGSVLALGAVAGIAALSNQGDDVGTLTSATEPSVHDDGTILATTEPPTATEPPPVTAVAPVVPATVTPTAAPPSPSSVPTTTITPARERAQALVDLIAEEMSNGLDRNEAVAMVESINQALDAAEAGQTNEVERALRDVRRRIDRRFADDTRDEAIERLVALGSELGVEPDQIVGGDQGPPGRGGDDEDDD